MKIKLFAALIIGAVFSFGVSAQDITTNGVTFPAKLKIGNDMTEYNGSGLRTKYFIKLYVAALYLPNKSKDAQAIIDQDETSAVRLKILSNRVTRERFIETVRDGFATSTEGKATQAEIDQLMGLFNTEFNAGDDIILAYRPSQGIEVYMNGKRLGSVKGLEFKKALWGIWLGEKPADSSVKAGMLGG